MTPPLRANGENQPPRPGREVEQRILDHIGEHGPATVPEMTMVFSDVSDTIRTAAYRLEKRGELIRLGRRQAMGVHGPAGGPQSILWALPGDDG